MKIEHAEIRLVRIPFEDGGAGTGLMPTRWTHLEMVLLRLRCDQGVEGWGEAFAYSCASATEAALRDMLLPLVVGKEIDDIAGFCRSLVRAIHLQGRFGIACFALSAIDIALHDIAARRAAKPLSQFIADTLPATLLTTDSTDNANRSAPRVSLPAYASLVRYTEPELVARFTAQARSEGYRHIKLHEIALDAIKAGRRAADGLDHLVTDVNCNWSLEQAHDLLPRMRDMGLYWVEEPVFPPDDGRSLGALERQHGVALASGENACLRESFESLAGAIRFVQPSVTKVGGLAEFLAVCELGVSKGSVVMPHSPYFGPGYWATMHVMAAVPACELFEFLYIEPENWIDPSMPVPIDGTVQVPQGPGLGFEPSAELLARYEVRPPQVVTAQ